ncbi:MAG: gfo/Idh/MocA family oxidoreductase [Proteobacteria bacterium]|nr:gfo/Idh/MocA family oxidoreductase [Pseudomonadota bacterium]
MVTFGVIGAGGIANKLHLPQIHGMPNATVKRITGRSEARLRILADRWSIPHWSHDWHDVLDDPEIDAVIVALPHPMHVPAGLAVLAAGKHLLMQKPLCDQLDDADRFVEAADAAFERGIVTLAMPHFAPETRPISPIAIWSRAA